MEKNLVIHPVTVFAGNINEVIIVKSLLENAEVASYLKDEIQGTMTPWVVAPGGAGAVKVTVSSEDEKIARLVVKEFLKNRTTEDNEELIS